MEKQIRGRVYVVGDHVDTDQIIPAEFLSYNPSDPEERKFFGRYAMSGVPGDQAGLPDGGIPFTPEGEFTSEFAVIVAGENFGCGSSREHAPLAIAEAGCRVIVAESYARIFYRNCVNGGYCAPLVCGQRLVETLRTGDEVEVEVDIDAAVLRRPGDNAEFRLESLGDAAEIIEAGGIFAYARKTGMIAQTGT